MTKYILHGGRTGITNEGNRAFYQEWVKDIDEEKVPTILLCYFARLQEDWPRLASEDQTRFAEYTENRQAHFFIASTDIKIFQNQLEESDVLYIRGGKPEEIIEVLDPIKDEFTSLLEGKVYAGSSAGVMFLSQWAASHERAWKQCWGLLPFHSFVHYDEDVHQDMIDKFQNKYRDNQDELLLIPESEFLVRYY